MENHIVAAENASTKHPYSSSVAAAASLLVVAAAAALLSFIISYFKAQYHGRKLPPGPPGLPLIGHLHLLSISIPTHRSLFRLSQKYGPLFCMRFGSVPAVVVSSPTVAKQFLLTHDYDFLDRPSVECARIFYQNRTLAFARYGSAWRELRKIYTLEILSSKKIEMCKHVRSEEVGSALQEIELQSLKGGFVMEMSRLLYNLAGNVMTRTLFSKRAFGSFKEAPEFREMMVEMTALAGSIVIGDFIPNLHWLDPQGYKKRMDSVFKRMDAFLDRVVSERLLERQKISVECVPKDFLDVLIDVYKGSQEEVATDAIKSSLLDLLFAGAETSSTAIEWAMLELLRNPRVMKKLHEELDNVVGAGKPQVEESDIPKLEYLRAVVKENFRLHPPLPLLIHQMSRPAAEVGDVAGYYIPEKSMMVVNVWAIGRDPLVWDNAEKFMPERFMGSCSSMDVRGQHFELLPFGSGRRGCPGINLGLRTVELVISNLVYRFDWSLPEGESPETLDMMDKPGLTAPKAKPLLAVPKARN